MAWLNGTAAAYSIRGNYSYRVGFDGFVFKRLCDFLNIVEGERASNSPKILKVFNEATSASTKYKS